MRFVLDRTLFAPQSRQEALDLLQLLVTAAQDPQHHVVQTDPPYVLGAGNQEADAWLGRMGPDEAAVLRAVLASGNVAAAGAPRVGRTQDQAVPPWWHLAESFDVLVERRAGSDWPSLRLTLQDALALLQEPVHLVLENEWNDFAFVAHLAGPTDGPALRSLREAPGRLHVHGGGGGAAKTWLEYLAEPPSTSQKWRLVLRTWVLFDQDSGGLDAREPSQAADLMRQACERVRTAFHDRLSWACLRRREIESYVPDAGLLAEATAARAAMVQQVIAWRAAPGSERHGWAFDLKKGLRGDFAQHVTKAARDAVHDGQLALSAGMLKVPFDALGPAEVVALELGFGKSRLNDALCAATPARTWAPAIPAEYDRGPSGQAPRVELLRSLFERI